jgi:hypothetical protein
MLCIAYYLLFKDKIMQIFEQKKITNEQKFD